MAASAKTLALRFLIFGLLLVRGLDGQYDQVPADLDAHTDQGAYSDGLGYGDFTPDESDIKHIYGAGTHDSSDKKDGGTEQGFGESDNHSHQEKKNVEHHVEVIEESSDHGAVNHNGDEKNGNVIDHHERHPGSTDNEKLTDEEVLRNELRKEQERSQRNYMVNEEIKSNGQVREDLLRAQLHDSIQQMNDKKDSDLPQQNNGLGNGGSERKSVVDSNERPIKEIHDTVEQVKTEHNSHETTKHEAERKEQKLRISKLIMAAKKNGDDVKTHDPSTSSPEVEQRSSSPDGGNVGSSKPWIDEIVTTDGGVMQMRSRPNHVGDQYDTRDPKLNVNGEQKNPDSDQHDEHGSHESDSSKGKSREIAGDEKLAQTDNTGHSAEHHNTDSVTHEQMEIKSRSDDDARNSNHVKNEQSNHGRKAEIHETNTIMQPVSNNEEEGNKRLMDDEQIFESQRFIEMKNQYITRYLDDHYKDKQVSPQLLQQIVQLITEDLKKQWRLGQREIFADTEKSEHNDQDQTIKENEELHKRDENKQTDEDKPLTRGDSQQTNMDAETHSRRTDEHAVTEAQQTDMNAETHPHKTDEGSETEAKVGLNKKTEKNEGRPARSILSSMVRSSLSLTTHEKLHDSSIATARSSSLALTMATKDSRSDVTSNTASASVTDILSTSVEESQQDTGNEAEQHVTTGQIDATKSSEPNKKLDDTYSDIFTESDEKDLAGDNDDNHSSGKDPESTQVKGGLDASENETKQDETSSEGKLFKAGSPVQLSEMSDPDPKINKWIQLPVFQNLRKSQVENYIDAQFAGKYLTAEELKGIDDLITKSMKKDLSDKNSGLRAWIMDSMGGDNFEDDEKNSEGTENAVDEDRSADSLETIDQKIDKPESDHKDEAVSEDIEGGTPKDTADIIKAKRKKLSDILSSSHHESEGTDQTGAAESVVSEIKEEIIKESASVEAEKEDEKVSDDTEGKKDVEKDETGYLDSIWGFFGGSSDDTVSEKETKEVEEQSSKSEHDSEENIKDQDQLPDSDDSVKLSVAEDEEAIALEDQMDIENSSKSEDTSDQETVVTHSDSVGSNTISGDQDNTYTEESHPTATAISNKTSEFLDTVISKELDSEKNPTSAYRPTASSTVQITNTMAATTAAIKTAERKVIDDITGEEFTTVSPSSSVDQIHGTQRHIPEDLESVDMEHEKSKYKMTETGHEHVTGSVDADNEAAETDPLKKLCKKYPGLKACKEAKPVTPLPEVEEHSKKMEGSFAPYIKYFTKYMNSWVYAVFAYIVQCIKSLVRVLCVSTVGMFLNLLGREQISSSLTEDYDAITTEYFAVYMFLFISYASFGWYYKNSTMTPIVKVGDNFNKKDDKKVKNAEDQLNALMKKMEKEKNEKEKTQKQLEKEIDINEKMHQENKDLKKYIEETKSDKKRIKELTGSIKDHENKMKGKDKELEKLRLAVKTMKDDLKENKDKYKLLEDKHRYVEKESDSKDDTIADLEDRKKELETQLSSKDKDVAEKGALLEDLSTRVTDLQEKQSNLEENMKKEKEITQKLEEERKALQETLLNIDKINYEGKLENGFHNIECEDGTLNVSMDEDVKAERLQNIINAIKLKAEHLEAVTELSTCKKDLSVYRTKSDELEVNMTDLSSKFESLSTESEELKKGIEKKNIELQTITKFFGEREAEFQRLNVSQKEEIQKLSKQMDLIGDEKREMSELIKKIDELKEEIEKNQKDYKQQIATVEEQSHANYLKMRNAIRECDEHKREKEVYRKRLLDIDMTPQNKMKPAAVVKPPVSLDRSDSPGSNKSTEALPDTSVSKPGQQQVPSQAAPPFGAPPMFPRGVPQFPPNPMASALYRVPPVGPYGMPPGRPPFMGPMRPPMPPNAHMNRANVPPMNPSNSMAPQMGQPNLSMSAMNAQMGGPNIPMSAPNAQMNTQSTPMNPSVGAMNTSNSNTSQPAMVPQAYSTPGQHMPPGPMATPPRIPGPRPYGMPPGAHMMHNQSTPNIMTGPGHPTNMQTPGTVAAGVPMQNA